MSTNRSDTSTCRCNGNGWDGCEPTTSTHARIDGAAVRDGHTPRGALECPVLVELLDAHRASLAGPFIGADLDHLQLNLRRSAS